MSNQDDVAQADRMKDVQRIKERIETLINQRFDAGFDSFYLSQLGSILGSDRLLIEKLTHSKLAEFIRRNFDFEIKATGIHGNVLYIVRPGSLGVEPQKFAIPRYAGRFWAAFAVPLPPGMRRFINVHSLVFGPDEGALGGHDAGVREITPEFISPDGASESSNEIAARIDKWLEKEGFDRNQFLLQRRRLEREANSSVLEQLLDALDGEQLRRVSLPLDIVRTLCDRRVR